MNNQLRENGDKLLRLKEVMDMVGIKKTTIYNYMKEGFFPQRIKIKSRVSCWALSDIENWIETQKTASMNS